MSHPHLTLMLPLLQSQSEEGLNQLANTNNSIIRSLLWLPCHMGAHVHCVPFAQNQNFNLSSTQRSYDGPHVPPLGPGLISEATPTIQHCFLESVHHN